MARTIDLGRVVGPQGPQGETGPQGEQGLQGVPGRDGAPGEKGEPGEKGDTGEKGDAGEKGDPGEKGEPGQDGRDGTNASASVAQGEADQYGNKVTTITCRTGDDEPTEATIECPTVRVVTELPSVEEPGVVYFVLEA